jgi:hypothetical protein
MSDALEKQVGGSHYSQMSIQPVEFIEWNKLSFLEGCIIKRLCRLGNKPGTDVEEDLYKILHEVDLIIGFQDAGIEFNRCESSMDVDTFIEANKFSHNVRKCVKHLAAQDYGLLRTRVRFMLSSVLSQGIM